MGPTVPGGLQCSAGKTIVLAPIRLSPDESSSSIAAHPSLPFWIIINPASGPGAHGSQAPVEYQQCIPILRASSVVVLGYVPTFEGVANKQSVVTQDIDTYAGWGAGFRPVGIFFDQVSGASGDFATYQGFTEHAAPLFNGGSGFVSVMASKDR